MLLYTSLFQSATVTTIVEVPPTVALAQELEGLTNNVLPRERQIVARSIGCLAQKSRLKA